MVSLVGQLSRWSAILEFNSVYHFRYSAAPEPSGFWLIDRVFVDERDPGSDSWPLEMDVGMSFPPPEANPKLITSQQNLLCLRTVGAIDLEVVAASAHIYVEPEGR